MKNRLKLQSLCPDTITIERIKEIHPKLKTELSEIYSEIVERNLPVRFTDVFRSIADQNVLFEQGRSKPGRVVTHARGGQSFHNYGLAVDFCLLTMDANDTPSAIWEMQTDFNKNSQNDWGEVVFIFKHFGWEWGGEWIKFTDTPHFQKTFNYTTKDLLDKHQNGEVDTEGYVHL